MHFFIGHQLVSFATHPELGPDSLVSSNPQFAPRQWNPEPLCCRQSLVPTHECCKHAIKRVHGYSGVTAPVPAMGKMSVFRPRQASLRGWENDGGGAGRAERRQRGVEVGEGRVVWDPDQDQEEVRLAWHGLVPNPRSDRPYVGHSGLCLQVCWHRTE